MASGTTSAGIAGERRRDFRADPGYGSSAAQRASARSSRRSARLVRAAHAAISPRVRFGVAQGRHQRQPDVGSVAGAGSPGPPSSTCSATPDGARRDAVRIPPPDAQHDDRGDDRRDGPSQKTAEPAMFAGEEQQHAGEDGPDLARDAVVEGQRPGPADRRDDVVERAPGGVGEAALGTCWPNRNVAAVANENRTSQTANPTR